MTCHHIQSKIMCTKSIDEWIVLRNKNSVENVVFSVGFREKIIESSLDGKHIHAYLI